MDTTSVRELLAEIGVDMEVFQTAEHLASWAAFAPGNNESAGKKAHTPCNLLFMGQCNWEVNIMCIL